MAKGKIATVATVIIVVASQWVTAAPIIDFKLNHYEVTGSTVAEIKRSISQRSPIRTGHRAFGGLTHWQLDSTYTTMSVAEGCKVINPVVYLSVQVTLPKLIPGLNTPPAVLQEWERFLGALRAHELQHAVSGQHTARKVEQRLTNLQTRYNCERTKAMLTESTAALIHDSNRFDVELDKRTKHGLTQGAYLREEVGQSNKASR